jgi:hypothetical protein
MANENKKCGHEGCMCAVRDGEEFCSPHCENADDSDMTEILCGCGHPGCS